MRPKHSILVACAIALVASAANAQTPDAPTVLANVQQYYANANQLTAQFRQVVKHAAYGTTQTSDGKLWVAKPGKFRFDYFHKSGNIVTVAKTFAFDGTTLWFIDHPNKQIFQQQGQSGVLPAAISFLTNASALASQFNVSLVGHATQGTTTLIVLKLTPKQPSALYNEIHFVVNTADWHVSESSVLEPNGDTNDFKFYTPDLQAPISSSWFQVTPSALPTYKVINNTSSGSATPVPPASNSMATKPGIP